jgi:pimeloyl-ACP methyl ester carboxylesterase
MARIHHNTITVEGVDVFVRQAGPTGAPPLVLLHGFPTSSRQYIRLIDKLSDRWRVVAPDYPGFGESDPVPGTPTFDRLAATTARVIDTLDIADYALYLFDFGAPVGFRVALQHDDRVKAIITQNANAYLEGIGDGLKPIADWWTDAKAHRESIDWLLSLDGTRTQWLAGARDPEHVDPSQARADQAILDLPGRTRYAEALLWDYQATLPRYTEFQAWLRANQPALLAIWGRNDPFFVPAGAEAYRRDLPDAEVVLLDTGHFALEEELDTIADRVDRLLSRHLL